MKKKLTPLALVFIFVLLLLPDSALAANNDFVIKDGSLTEYNGSGGNVTIPTGVTYIAHNVFLGCNSLTSVIIPSSVTWIGEDAFRGCSGLTSISISHGVTTIEEGAFYECSSLTSVTIPSSIATIGTFVFAHCSSLTSVAIPNSVTSIESFAFWDCNSLTDVYYAGSETDWNSISISRANEPLTSANIHFNSIVPDAPSTPATPSTEYIYDTADPSSGVILNTERLETVTDIPSAVSAVQNQIQNMTPEQKASASGADLATLYAETAAAKATARLVTGSTILISAAAVSDLEPTAVEASKAVETALTDGGVTTARYLSKTVLLTTEEQDLSIQIDPNVLTTEVDKVWVETPTYALTFKLSDLAPDLTETLKFTSKNTVTGSRTRTSISPAASSPAGGTDVQTITMSILANAAVPAVEIDMPGGKTTNSITVSLPSDSGDTTYRTVATSDGTATASKYNPATTMMDGKINTSGTYTVKSNEKDFTDIANKSAEMQKAIRYLASKGIINGTTPTTFSPDGSINRAEIATLLVKALGKLDSTATASFSDVTKSNWFYTAAASSQRHKLINGYEDNTFRGTTNISKVQIVAVSSRVLKTEMGYKEPASPATYLSKYSDTIDSWAQSEVALATKENLVVYRTDGTFSGDKT